MSMPIHINHKYEFMKPKAEKYREILIALLVEKSHEDVSYITTIVDEVFDFKKMLIGCDYAALHDDPEIWADKIYKYFIK